MSYLEELLPEFRKGAKIRCKGWEKGKYIHIPEPETGEVLDEEGKVQTIPFWYTIENFWEFYQEPIDWDYIIKNKCLCWFWDNEDEPKVAGLLITVKEGSNIGYIGSMGVYFKCLPVRRDEVTFYEDRK